MASTARRAFAVMSLVALPIAAACSGSPSPPQGSGDDVSNDTRDAEARPAANPTPTDAGPDAPGPLYGNDASVSYPGITECGGCSCDPSVGYCFGGATLRPTIRPLVGAGDGGAAGDAGLPACPLIDAGGGGAPELGCNPLPASCTDCPCVIGLLQPQFSCYLVCASDAVGKPVTVYCPNP